VNNQDESSPKVEFNESGFIKGYTCPKCGGKLKLDHKDDIGQKWFKCQKCGRQTCKPKSPERKKLEEALERQDFVLHPAGGVTEDFVYEPVGVGEYVYKTRDGKKAITKLKVEYEDPEKKKGRRLWFIIVEGKQYYFLKKPPKEWLFSMPERAAVEKWVNGEKGSLSHREIWSLNSVYLGTFLDFPHKYEFSVGLLFIQQTWLTEVIPVVFYLGVRGEFGGGKTVTGEAICLICRHGYLTGNLSPPFVARAIQEQKITLMVDELDSVAGSKDSNLNSIFRQGYRRGSRYSRIHPDTLEPQSFEIFGPKLYTVHSEIEQALQTRTIPIHVRETANVQYPIVNLDKTAFATAVYTENFLWYMDNILDLKNNQFEKIQSLSANELDILDLLDLKKWGHTSEKSQTVMEKTEEITANIRTRMFLRKKALLQEGQVSQVSQVTGRNVELMFLCFTISNMVAVDVAEDLKHSFQQKIVEESERTELGYLGVLRDLLFSLWNEKNGDKQYKTEAGEVKISNKEVYNRFNESLKKEYDRGVSPATFKGYMLEFGFTDALNRKKLEVPIPGDPKGKSRLCNIFTARVLRKLGIQDEEAPSVDNKPTDLKSVHWAGQFYGEHECCICGYQKKTSWQAEDFKGNKHWICEDCKLEWEKQRNSLD